MSFGIRGAANLTPLGEKNQEAPAAPQPQVQNWLRRRLEDAVEDVFRAALQRGDLASAEELLGVMENMHARARVRFHAERKGTAMMIDRARKELESRKLRRRQSTP
ncbi:MAG TPA: hypothetical protein VND19_23435 [Acetobacteraceae bacterium]|nr:hypothetical protein [Acetobacteraceae bacterium]